MDLIGEIGEAAGAVVSGKRQRPKGLAICLSGGGYRAALFHEVQGFRTSAGTIQFTLDHPLPDELVERLVRICIARNESKRKK